jgi:ketosteroid isomerase-like protein
VRTFMKGNMVAMEGVQTGTHTGDFMGHAATNKKIGHRFFTILWFNDDGLIQKEHMYRDHATMLGHLGKGDPKLKHRNLENVPTTTLEQIAPGDNALESKNEAAARAWFGTFEKKDDKGYLAAISDDVTHADYTRPEDVKGKDAAKKAWGELLKTFPDLKMNPTSVMAIGEYVIAEVEMTGTMKGDLGSVKSSGKSGTVHIVDVLRFNKDGKIAWAGRWGSRMEFANAFGVPATLSTATTPPAKK